MTIKSPVPEGPGILLSRVGSEAGGYIRSITSVAHSFLVILCLSTMPMRE